MCVSYPAGYRHQVLVLKDHEIIDFMIAYNHSEEGHMDNLHVPTAVREQNWIVKGNIVVSRLLEICAICRRRNASVGQQLMAFLPMCRTEQGPWRFSSLGWSTLAPSQFLKAKS